MVWLYTCQHIVLKYLKITGVSVTLSTSDGYFNPEVVKYRQLCAKSQRKRKMFSIQQYYHRLLKQILVSRKVNSNILCVHTYITVAIRLIWKCFLVVGAPWVCRSQWTGLSTEEEVTVQNSGRTTGAKGEKKIESHIKGGQSWVWRQQRLIWWRWFVIFFFFSNLFQCSFHILLLINNFLADFSLWNQAPQSPTSPTPSVSLRILPSLCTQDMKSTGQWLAVWNVPLQFSRMYWTYNSSYHSSTDKIDLGEHDLKIMLQNHREKRKRQPVRIETWIWVFLCFRRV